jgi:hypothetical protein
MPTFDLNCLILGHNHTRVFPIKIGVTETVGTLKEAINDKKHLTFQHIEADTLALCRLLS